MALHTDAASFLAVAGAHLDALGIVASVVRSTAERTAAGPPADAEARPPHSWYATVHENDDTIVGAAMRTAPFAPYPLTCCRCPTTPSWRWRRSSRLGTSR